MPPKSDYATGHGLYQDEYAVLEELGLDTVAPNHMHELIMLRVFLSIDTPGSILRRVVDVSRDADPVYTIFVSTILRHIDCDDARQRLQSILSTDSDDTISDRDEWVYGPVVYDAIVLASYTWYMKRMKLDGDVWSSWNASADRLLVDAMANGLV